MSAYVVDIISKTKDSEPGTVIYSDKSSIYTACGEGILAIDELQLEGKKRMSTHDFLLGVRIQTGERFGI